MTHKQKPNRLITEKSPYLLQHAHNPVNWYPWGDEAFQKAQQENKPIFLSIGYSTCHWCHVMAHESFEDEEVASIINEKYVAIKVDREERPDIDSIYMKVCQMMTGHGGWPLSIFMTPDKVPFYAGTYFPKESKYGRPGFIEVLTQLHRKYTEDPDHIAEVTESVTNALEKTITAKSEHRLTKETLDQAYNQLAKNFDFTYGGFGEAPKFPMPQNLLFLLRHYHFTKNKDALKMVEMTLNDMAKGGIWDHIGFGFSRYSTDDEWLVPHFEKMLYDNALLLIAYTECYQVTKNPFYQKIAEQIITFIQREMTGEDGAFYSAIDADSEGVEGKYYVWSHEEVFEVLGNELGSLFTKTYDITSEGNFEGKNIPNLIDTDVESLAKNMNVSTEKMQAQLEQARQQLLAKREQRIYPHVDDKVLTSWNGLMIAGLAKAGKVFQKPEYMKAAEKSIHFMEKNLFLNGRLQARFREGEAKYNAFLDDYAFLLWGYIELYDSTFSLEYLQKARELADQMIDLFWDEKDGGFYFSGRDNETLIAKDKDIYDGAIPSGNSVAAVMLTRLGFLTGESSYLDKVDDMFYSFYSDINRIPSASPFFLQSLQLMEYPTKEVVILKEADDQRNKEIFEQLFTTFLPNVALLVTENPEMFTKVAPFAAPYKKIEESTTLYVCENFACKQPTTNLDEGLRAVFNSGIS